MKTALECLSENVNLSHTPDAKQMVLDAMEYYASQFKLPEGSREIKVCVPVNQQSRETYVAFNLEKGNIFLKETTIGNLLNEVE